MAKIVLTRTFESTNAREIDMSVNNWLQEMQTYQSLYKFKLFKLQKFYDNGKHIVNTVFEINSIWASNAMR